MAIWVTMAGAIAIVAIANSYLQVIPPKKGFIEGRIWSSMETLAGLVEQDKTEMARTLVRELATIAPPVTIEMKQAPEMSVDQCRGEPPIIDRAYAPIEKRCYVFVPKREPDTFFDDYMPVILPSAAALVASLISSFMLAQYLVRPIMTLRASLRTLAGGVFSVRIGNTFGRRRDEIASLGQDFDIAATKLEELQAGQRRLFHDVSHELRSPLSRLQAAIGLIKRNPQRVDALLPRMQREMERLDHLVEEILTLARLDTESQNQSRQMVDIIDLLGAIVDDASFEANSHGVSVEYSAPDTFVAEVSGELIYRAIENVIRNAIKYSPRGGVVIVMAAVLGDCDRLSIIVRNDGPLVSGEDLERIFHPFTRLEEGSEAEGYGLGLAITRRAVEAHGGHATAIANPEGGLTLQLTVPR